MASAAQYGLLELREHDRPGNRRTPPWLGEHLLDGRDDSRVGPSTGRLRAQCPLIGQPDEALVPVCLAQPLKVPLRHLRASRLELGKFR
jgi:hypothetical protein